MRLLLASLLLVLFCPQVNAEAFPFAEIKLGWKYNPSSSVPMRTWCQKVYVYEHFQDRSCGGRNPLFGFRVGWEFDGARFPWMKNVSVGGEHQSHVRDGTYNNRPEIHFDMFFVSKKWGGRP